MLNLNCLSYSLFSWIKKLQYSASHCVSGSSVKTVAHFSSLTSVYKDTHYLQKCWKVLNAAPSLLYKHHSGGNFVFSPELFPHRFCTDWIEISGTCHTYFFFAFVLWTASNFSAFFRVYYSATYQPGAGKTTESPTYNLKCDLEAQWDAVHEESWALYLQLTSLAFKTTRLGHSAASSPVITYSCIIRDMNCFANLLQVLQLFFLQHSIGFYSQENYQAVPCLSQIRSKCFEGGFE